MCIAACIDDPDGVSGQSVLAQFDVTASGQTTLLHGGQQVARRRDAVWTGAPRGRPRHPMSRHQRNVARREDTPRQTETVALSPRHQGFDQRSDVNEASISHIRQMSPKSLRLKVILSCLGYITRHILRGGRFLPRNALQCKAQYCDCMSSVRSVPPSVCNVVGSGAHRSEIWKLTARTISPTSSLFVAQRPST